VINNYDPCLPVFSALPLNEFGSNLPLSKKKYIFFIFILTISCHFHLKNIKLIYLLHSTCDLHLFRFVIESYLSSGLNYPNSSRGNVGLTKMIFSLYIISCHFHIKNIKFLHIICSTCDLYLFRSIIEF